MALIDIIKWEAAVHQIVRKFPNNNDGLPFEGSQVDPATDLFVSNLPAGTRYMGDEAGNDATLRPYQLWVNVL